NGTLFASSGNVLATSTLTVNNGGTGVGTFGTNGILFGNGTGAIQATAPTNTSALVTNSSGIPSLTSGAVANRVLRTDGSTISFAQLALGTDVSGTLPVANGGTGTTTSVSGQLIYGGGAGVYQSAATTTVSC